MRFTKMQGVGNDFVLVNAADAPADADWPEMARQACARHVGVGADGLLVAGRTADSSAGVSMRMFNPDGSEDMCGNGLRCVARWAHRAGWAQGDCFSVATLSGPRRVEVLRGGSEGQVCVEMGIPQFAPADVPFLGIQTLSGSDDAVLRYPLAMGGEIFFLNSVNTGSTHTVIFGDAPPSEDTFLRVSPRLETHPLFPERTSVLWATTTGTNTFAVRIWERGAGETWGCGTGACAVGVLARVLGLATPGPIFVVSRGGTLEINWPGRGQQIQMTGPAEFVFEGEIQIV